VIIRDLTRDEIPLVWTIDRREVIERIYRLKDGTLIAESHRFDVQGWPPGEAEKYTPLLQACFDRGGVFRAMFDGDRLVGVAALDSSWLGPQRDLLQLEFLHVSHAYRGQGIGVRLFEEAATIARQRGARGLYVSATPSEHTVHFYQRRGCVVTPTPDPELLALEPEDIHFECRFDATV
jgi:predicted N-acetyltransferase YhbS